MIKLGNFNVQSISITNCDNILKNISEILKTLTNGNLKLKEAIAKLEGYGLTPKTILKDGINFLVVNYKG